MSQFERCKACGLVMKSSKNYAICPACGVPRTAFEVYRETLSERRKFILDLHMHPISVHFPQALSTLLLLMLIADLVSFPVDFSVPIELFAFILPVTAGAAFVSGLIDAKTRFKKLTTPFIVKKTIFGFFFLSLSIVIAAVAYFFKLEGTWKYVVIAASTGCVACQGILGIIGIQLMFAKLPGK